MIISQEDLRFNDLDLTRNVYIEFYCHMYLCQVLLCLSAQYKSQVLLIILFFNMCKQPSVYLFPPLDCKYFVLIEFLTSLAQATLLCNKKGDMPVDSRRVAGPENTLQYYLYSKHKKTYEECEKELLNSDHIRKDGRKPSDSRKICKLAKSLFFIKAQAQSLIEIVQANCAVLTIMHTYSLLGISF